MRDRISRAANSEEESRFESKIGGPHVSSRKIHVPDTNVLSHRCMELPHERSLSCLMRIDKHHQMMQWSTTCASHDGGAFRDAACALNPCSTHVDGRRVSPDAAGACPCGRQRKNEWSLDPSSHEQGQCTFTCLMPDTTSGKRPCVQRVP